MVQVLPSPDCIKVLISTPQSEEILVVHEGLALEHLETSVRPPGPVAPGDVVVVPTKHSLGRAQVLEYRSQVPIQLQVQYQSENQQLKVSTILNTRCVVGF